MIFLYLVEAKEAKFSDHIERAHSWPRGDLTSNLKTNLNDFQRVGENDLRATGLENKTEILMKPNKTTTSEWNSSLSSEAAPLRALTLTHPPARISATNGIVSSFVVNLSLTKSLTCKQNTL